MDLQEALRKRLGPLAKLAESKGCSAGMSLDDKCTATIWKDGKAIVFEADTYKEAEDMATNHLKGII
jgi:cystathionine beta-lyase/cystathionine gamma-synthase